MTTLSKTKSRANVHTSSQHRLRKRAVQSAASHPVGYTRHRFETGDFRLTKSQSQPSRKQRPTNARKPRKSTKKKVASSPSPTSANKKKTSLSQLLTPKNMQETVKTVTNLRGMVKNWLGYLQQADKMLDTVFVTTSSLKESGVLDKIIKQKGKNLSTEDFTSILAALMSSPMASSFLGGGDDDKDDSNAEKPATSQAQSNAQAGRPQPNGQMGGALPPGTGGSLQQPRM